MSAKWSDEVPAAAGVLERVRAEALAEAMSGAAVTDWHRDVAVYLFATTALTALVLAALRATGGWAVTGLADRGWTLGLVFAAQALAAPAALAPRASRLQVTSLVAAGLAMVAIVALRTSGAPGEAHPIVCTLSHLALAAGPLAVGLLLLRHAAFTSLRALSAGVAAGAIGAAAGEVGCGRDAWHLLAFHLPAWLLAMGIAWVVARRLTPRSFAL